MNVSPNLGLQPRPSQNPAKSQREEAPETDCTIGFRFRKMSTAEQQADPPGVLRRARDRGRIEVFPSVVAAMAGHAAVACYGVMGMSARGLRDGVAQLLRRENLDKSVDVREAEGQLVIDLYVIVEYGTRT